MMTLGGSESNYSTSPDPTELDDAYAAGIREGWKRADLARLDLIIRLAEAEAETLGLRQELARRDIDEHHG